MTQFIRVRGSELMNIPTPGAVVTLECLSMGLEATEFSVTACILDGQWVQMELEPVGMDPFFLEPLGE